jgi:peroxiredoxin
MRCHDLLVVLQVAALGAVICVSSAWSSAQAQAPPAEPGPKIVLGEYAPSVYGHKLSGGTVSLASYRGRYVLLVFWAAWCSASRTDMPNIIAADREAGGDKFAVLSCSLDKEGTFQMLKDWVDGLGIKFPVIYDGNGGKGDAPVAYGVRYIPAMFIVDPKGRIIMKDLGGDSLPRIAKKLTEVGGAFKPIDANVTLVDPKPTADGLRVKVEVTNPEGGDYDVRVDFSYAPKGTEQEVYRNVTLKGQGAAYTGEAILPIPVDAADVTVQAGVRSALLGELVYGDFVSAEG